MNNRILRVTMALGLVLVGLGISIAGAKNGKRGQQAKNQGNQQPNNQGTQQSQPTAKNTKGKIKTPAVGSSLTMQQLVDLINTNNPAQNSKFSMLAINNGPRDHFKAMTADVYEKQRDFSRMGSVSPLLGEDSAGKKLDVLNFSPATAAAVQGTFKLEPATKPHLDAVLSKFKRGVTADDQKKLAKVMLWFRYQPVAGGPTYALFIFDPWCSTIHASLQKWS